MPQIEVTFDIDANGILNVSAKDKATNKEQKITITASTGLSKEEAEKMRTEAESHAEDDRKRMEEVEARNRLDGIIYQAEKTIRENRDKLRRRRRKASRRSAGRCKESHERRRCAAAAVAQQRTSRSHCTRWRKSCTRRRKRQAAQSRPARPVRVRHPDPRHSGRRRAGRNKARRRNRRGIRGRGRKQEAELSRRTG